MSTLTFLAFCSIIALVTSNTIGRVSYGEECNKDIRCDSRQFLTCSNGKCSCLMPDTMFFENSTRKCVSLAGERCMYTTLEAEKTWTDEVACIANASCQQGICECGISHYEISNGTCQERHKYGEDCYNDQMCHSSKHQVCTGNGTSQKICSCRYDRVYEEQLKECFVKAGHFCTSIQECVTYAACESNQFTSLSGLPTSKVCRCTKGYFETDRQTCEPKRDLGDTCTENKMCKNYRTAENGIEMKTFYSCNNGKCECDPLYSMKYTAADGVQYCGKLLGLPCKDGECFTGANCSRTCQCINSTYFQTEQNTCELRRSHYKPCTENKHCINSLICDKSLGSGVCECEGGRGFHAGLNSCAIVPGHSCNRNRGTNQCVPNAECAGSSYDSRCSCMANFAKGKRSFKYCYVKENGTCNGDTYFGGIKEKTCLPGLKCRNNTCACSFKEHQIYNQDQERCFSLIEGPCNMASDCEDQNTKCVFEKGIGQCKCKTGFTQAGRQCDIIYGGKCSLSQKKPRCDRFGPLECSTYEECKCSDFQVYDNDTMKCRGLVGAKCSINGWGIPKTKGNQFCVDGATCRGFRGFEDVVGICVCDDGNTLQEDRTCKKIDWSTTTTTEVIRKSISTEFTEGDALNSSTFEPSYMADGSNDL